MLKGLIKNALSLIYRGKLASAVKQLEGASLEQLGDAQWVARIIREAGLRHDARQLYGSDSSAMNFYGPGLWQIPEQLAPCLVELGKHSIQNVLEVGIADGWTSVFMSAYLRRFEAGLKYRAMDPAKGVPFPGGMSKLSPVEFCFGKTSVDFHGAKSDLCFIDGDHSYEWCARDYENVGKHARICMFHDINDQLVGSENVPAFWKYLKENEAERSIFHEFVHHSENGRVMGIGLRIQKGPACS